MSSASGTDQDLNTSQITSWRSIITLIVFVATNLVVLFPFHISIPVPRPVHNALLDTLSTLRIIPPRRSQHRHDAATDPAQSFRLYAFPMNFITAPLIADLFLLAISAIGRNEVAGGTIGASGIVPLDIMAFFITLAYIAISIDASGLIRYLAFKVLQWGGKVGHRLFFFLYAFFFVLGSFIGNDPIILTGTAFLSYMTRVSSNIKHPRAWIHTQFAVANIASAVLVSSNPTNLVLASAFGIRFVDYTANMIIPVIITAIVLFPFLLYIVFADEELIPLSIAMHELPDSVKGKKPVNPNIPHARGTAEEEEDVPDEHGKTLSLEEIMNPFVDRSGAAFGAFIMAATLIIILVVNATSPANGEKPVFYITLPAAFVMFCWDLASGWVNREKTRKIARDGREAIEMARERRELEKVRREAEEEKFRLTSSREPGKSSDYDEQPRIRDREISKTLDSNDSSSITPGLDSIVRSDTLRANEPSSPVSVLSAVDEKQPETVDESVPQETNDRRRHTGLFTEELSDEELRNRTGDETDLERRVSREAEYQREARERPTLVSVTAEGYRWCQETFPTVTAVMAHLPFALVPFALSMFVLVQALVTKGWVPVFAYGWDHWVDRTGTMGAIGGMAFLSVILCNFAGTNIGTTILLSRVIQAWTSIHAQNGTSISDRTFWATVYSMAIGVNYGAFSTAFSASLAGLLWRDILARKHIHVRRLEFARVNLPIIAIAMAVGCAVLVGEVYIMRHDEPYVAS